jgi:hypothetical protein
MIIGRRLIVGDRGPKYPVAVDCEVTTPFDPEAV